MRTHPWANAKHAVAIVLALVCLTFSLPSAAAQQNQADPEELAEQGLVRVDDIEAGALLFETDAPGWYVPAPALHTNIDIAVTGPIARATVTQRFRNVAEVFVEGKYVFPLPEGAAVDTLRMKVGNRWIEGMVEEREEARLIYEEAKAAGQVASLVEQERPNVFTTSVANIAPGAVVIVQIEYQQSLAPRDGVFGLRVPLVVAPRYSPDEQNSPRLELSPAGWTDAGVAVPVVDPRTDAEGGVDQTIRNPVEISVDLDAGFPLGDVGSPFHDIEVEQRIENSADIALVGPVPADRDFYLSWKPRELSDPYTAVFTEYRENDTHYIAMLTPPSVDAIGDTRQPREVVFVQDTSGSMGGDSLAQAKAGLINALERLSEEDTFTIIEFNSVFTTFERAPVAANARNINRAVRWVDDLVATGGTEMLPALRTALRTSDASEGRLRQVIFLTDGAVNNELQMLNLIERELGNSRLFTVGIGSAPNSYFMTAAATSGRGSFVFIGDVNDVNDQMQALFAKIESPAIVDLTIEGFPVNVAVSPFPIPDLYAGDPIVLTVRVPGGVEPQTVSLHGVRGGEDWQIDLDLVDAQIRPGVSKLWAREHIRDLEALRVSPLLVENQREDIDEDILATALEFGLVSRLTSLVAVDVEVTRPDGTDSESTDVPTNLPAGWDPAIFFDDVNQSPLADDAGDVSSAALDRLNAAQGIRDAQATGQGGIQFAATGGDWQVRALLGASLMAIGAVAFVASGTRRRRW